MNYAPDHRKKVTLDWHADHDVYIEHQFNESKEMLKKLRA